MVDRRKIEELNQFELQYIHTWKCVAVLNKNVSFFFYKIGEQEGRTGPAWG
jgi:hypothetical protein